MAGGVPGFGVTTEPQSPILAAVAQIKVLLVEDSLPDARLLAVALEEVDASDFGLENVTRLDTALARLDTEPFDIALLDLSLPDSVGIDTFQRLRSRQPSLPIIVLTGLDDEKVAMQAMHDGAQDYIQKSAVTGEVLVKSMRYAIERQRMLSELTAQTAKLQESEASFRIIAAQADGLAVVDEDATVRFANPAAAAILGRSVGQPFGYPLVPGLITVAADGQNRSVELKFVNMAWEGRVAHLVSLRDVTEQRRLEAQLLQSQKMEVVGRMAGGLAHDFNNILTGISGHVELARFEVPADNPVVGHLEEVQYAVDRAARLIRQLLAFSRREVVEPRILDLNQIIASSERMFQKLVGSDVEISTAYGEGLPAVSADRSQLEQVVMNLVVNAGDAMGANGRLQIETFAGPVSRQLRSRLPVASTGTWVQLRVTDDGVGMDDETLEKVFEPFYTTKAAGKGTGLGLSTVYGIVRRFDGHILVDSEVGAGTTFHILFPAQQEEAPALSDAPLPSAMAQGTETLLVVDDERSVRELLERVLTSAGYEVLVAADGKQACDKAEAAKLDLLVSDVSMPELSGPQLYDRLKSRHPGLKVLFITGYAMDVPPEAAALPIVRKPFSFGALTQRVRAVLDGA